MPFRFATSARRGSGNTPACPFAHFFRLKPSTGATQAARARGSRSGPLLIAPTQTRLAKAAADLEHPRLLTVAVQCPADREQRATRQEAGRTARRASGLVLADVGELAAARAHETVRCKANRLFVR